MCLLCACYVRTVWALFSWCILTYIVYFSNLHSIRGDLWWSVGCVVGQSNPGTGPRRFTADRVVNYLLQWRSKNHQRKPQILSSAVQGSALGPLQSGQSKRSHVQVDHIINQLPLLFCYAIFYTLRQSWVYSRGLVEWKTACKHESGFLQ